MRTVSLPVDAVDIRWRLQILELTSAHVPSGLPPEKHWISISRRFTSVSLLLQNESVKGFCFVREITFKKKPFCFFGLYIIHPSYRRSLPLKLEFVRFLAKKYLRDMRPFWVFGICGSPFSYAAMNSLAGRIMRPSPRNPNLPPFISSELKEISAFYANTAQRHVRIERGFVFVGPSAFKLAEERPTPTNEACAFFEKWTQGIPGGLVGLPFAIRINPLSLLFLALRLGLRNLRTPPPGLRLLWTRPLMCASTKSNS